MSETNPGSRRRARRLATASVLTAILAAGVTPPSLAAPSRASLQRARQQLAALNLRLSSLALQYDLARRSLDQARGALVQARADSARAAAQEQTAEAAQVDAVRSAYEGTGSELAVILGATSPAQLSERAQFLGIIASQNANTVARAIVARRAAGRAASQVARLIRRESGLVASLAAEERAMTAAAAAQATIVQSLQKQLQRTFLPPAASRPPASDPPPAPAAGPSPSASPSPPPTPGPPTPPPPSPATVVAMILSIWGNNAAGRTAVCIAGRESGDNPYSRNPYSGAAGLFQLMSFWWDGSNPFGWQFDPYDARQNAEHAHLIWKMDGWAPWGGGC